MNQPKKRLAHVGIAVRSLEEAIPIFSRLLGGVPVERETVSGEQVRVASFDLGGTRIELLESTSDDSPVGRFVAKRGPGVHHIALGVEDIQRCLAELQGAGVDAVNCQPSAGAGGSRIAFLHPRSTAGVLIELVQDGVDDASSVIGVPQK